MKVFFIKRKSTGNLMGWEFYSQDGEGEYSPDTKFELEEVDKRERVNGSMYYGQSKVWCSTDKEDAESVLKKHSYSESYRFENAEHNFDDLEIIEHNI